MRQLSARPKLFIAASVTLVFGSGVCLTALADCVDWGEGALPLGTVDTPGWSNRIAAEDQYAYVSDGEGGLQIVDVAIPAQPEIVGSIAIPMPDDLDVREGMVFVTCSAGLTIVAAQDPSSPYEEGSISIEGSPWDVVLKGDHAYVACYHSGLHVIDVSDPANPMHVGSVDTPGEPRGLAVSGEYAYVADFNGGVKVISVSDPTSPHIVSTLDTPGEALGVAIEGDVALIADRYAGVQVADISDPTSPSIVGGVDTPDEAWRILVLDGWAYVADGLSGVHVIDIANPAQPEILGSVDTSGDASGIAVLGSNLVVADGASGMQVLPSHCEIPQTYTVRPDGTGDFPDIQTAISAASDGDTIEMTVGVFQGNGNRDIDFLGKVLTVRSQSANPAECIIDCQGSGRGFYLHSGESRDARIEGITIRNGFGNSYATHENDGGGILLESCSPTISNCVITSCEAGSDGGGIHCDSASPRIESCEITHNFAPWDCGGICCTNGSLPEIVDCLIGWNAGRDGGGIFLGGNPGGTAEVRNCTIIHNTASRWGGGINLKLDTTPVVDGCTIYGNAAGDVGGGVLARGGHVALTNSIIAESQSGGAVVCIEDGEASLACCDLYANVDGDWVGCIANQYGVNGNISLDPLFCDAASGDFQLDYASPCAPYSAPNDECPQIGAWPVGCGVAEYVILPDGSGDFPTIQAAIAEAAEPATILLGDGVYVGDGNRDVNFLGKDVLIQSLSGDASLCVVDCQGSETEPHRGFSLVSGEPSRAGLVGITVRNGYVTEPDGLGGAVLCSHGSPQFEGCIFEDNVAVEGGALWCDAQAEPSLEGCIFARNSAAFGGALGCDFSLPTISNCTFVENQATGTLAAGAGIECWNHASVTVENSILAFGLAGQGVRCHETASIDLSCSDVFGNANGDWVGCIEDQLEQAGNICQDPQFCDLAGDDFHLWNYSPCSQYSCGLIGALPVNCWDVQDIHGGGFAAVDLRLAVTPNPAFGPVTLGFEIPAGSTGTIEVFDAAGRVVRVFQATSPGGGVSWSQTDMRGEAVPAGIYYARLAAGARSVTRTLVVVR